MKRFVIYILLLIITFFCIYFIIKFETNYEKDEIDTLGKVSEDGVVPIPDRIIYKNQYNKYIIIDNEDKEFQYIYNELYNRITNIIDGKVYTEEEIRKMQENGRFIEFDYNTKSKNFVFMLEETDIGIIKRLTDSGQVIATTLSEKENLINKIEDWTKSFLKYNFNLGKSYMVNSKFNKLPNYLEVIEVEPGVHQQIINYNELDYKNAIKFLEINSSEVPEFDSTKETVVITLSKYEIKDITQNIGNIKYEFGEYQDNYYINILVTSKIVNTNCIYYNFDDKNNSNTTITENLNTSDDECAVEYYKENNIYYANYNNQRVKIISEEEACNIADIEAKNEKYQYQSWESIFYSREKYSNKPITIELISDLSQISKIYHWNEAWKISDYKNTLMWKVRMSDENDPLTSLYIYINAINGSIIGAGSMSD